MILRTLLVVPLLFCAVRPLQAQPTPDQCRDILAHGIWENHDNMAYSASRQDFARWVREYAQSNRIHNDNVSGKASIVFEAIPIVGSFNGSKERADSHLREVQESTTWSIETENYVHQVFNVASQHIVSAWRGCMERPRSGLVATSLVGDSGNVIVKVAYLQHDTEQAIIHRVLYDGPSAPVGVSCQERQIRNRELGAQERSMHCRNTTARSQRVRFDLGTSVHDGVLLAPAHHEPVRRCSSTQEYHADQPQMVQSRVGYLPCPENLQLIQAGILTGTMRTDIYVVIGNSRAYRIGGMGPGASCTFLVGSRLFLLAWDGGVPDSDPRPNVDNSRLHLTVKELPPARTDAATCPRVG